MHWLTAWAWVNCAVTYSLDALLCARILRFKLRVTPLLALVFTHLLTYPVAMVIAATCSPTTYMYAYCLLGLVDSLLHVLLIGWLFQQVRRGFSAGSAKLLLLSAAVTIVAVVCFGLHEYHPHTFFQVYYALVRDLAFARLIFLILFAVAVWLAALSWSPIGIRIFLGLILAAFSEAAVAESQIIARFTGYAFASYTPTVVYWAAVGVWLTMRRSPSGQPK